MPIAASVLAKAVRNNPIYARRLGWMERFQQISQKLGFTNMSPGPEAFAEGVFRWQGSHPPLKADGILGPRTWERLEPETRFTPGSASLPDWMKRPPAPPPVPRAADEEPEISTNVWFGLSVDFGGHLAVWGRNTLYAQLYSMDTYHRSFRMESERNRWGPGLGAGAGLSFVMITGLSRPRQLQGSKQTSWDFQLALGGRWGELIKGAGKVRQLRRLMERTNQSGGGMKRLVEFVRDNKETLTRLSPDDWNDIRKRIVEFGDAVDMAGDQSTPKIMSLGIPIPGTALEVSGYYQTGTLRIFAVREPVGG